MPRTLLFLALASATLARRYNTTSAPARGVTNVFLLPHSHDDVGWLKTGQQYFDGSRVISIDAGGAAGLSVYYANGAVQFILTSVVDALRRNPDRRFVVVEQWFFSRWWDAQEDDVRADVRALVAAKQLVFANGGLVMHDEACPTYLDMADQTAAGVRFIAETFGAAALPRVTSQLDPFGHSATQAALFASPTAGYIATFHARMDGAEGALRRATATLDFAWAPSRSLGAAATTMGSLGYFGYSTPDGFCLDVDIVCQAEGANVYSPTALNNPINDDATRGLPDAVREGDNVAAFVAAVLATAAAQAPAYTRDADGTVNLPWTMGDDFMYGAAQMNFHSMDRLIHYVNLNTSAHGVNIFYSTQADYARARLAADAPLALKTTDAFPYSSGAHSVWSGYFSSRAALKGFVRETSALSLAARQLQAWAAPPADAGPTNPLWLLEQGLGVAQHHDAVSGTSKQVVAFDYARRLSAGRAAAGAAMDAWISALLGVPAGLAVSWVACDLANATLCDVTAAAAASGGAVALFLHNAQSQARAAAPLRVPVLVSAAAPSWAALGGDGATPLAAQLVPASAADASLRAYYGAPAGAAPHWLCFYAPPRPAAGFAVVFVAPVAAPALAPATAPSVVTQHALRAGAPGANVSNGVVTLSFDADTGLLSGYASTSPGSAPRVALSQELLAYAPSVGDAADGQASGAYVFRPNASQAAAPVAPGGALSLETVEGPIVNEARQALTPWAWTTVRLWARAEAELESEFTVGPLPAAPLAGAGTELVSRWRTGWATGARWDTDSNGREWQPRMRDARPDYNLTLTEPVAMNYYPVNTAARLVDVASGAAMVVLTDRTQGGGSLADGDLELMVHRRLMRDDGKGVLEALNEPGVSGGGLVVRGAHRVLLAAAGAAAAAHRAALQDALAPIVWRAAALPAGSGARAWAAAALPRGANASLLAAPLPPNVFLCTLHALGPARALLRLAHTFEAGEGGALGNNATVALARLFAPPALRVVAAVELTLTGGQPLADVEPVSYRFAAAGGAAETVTLPVVPPPPAGDDLVVTLGPMQIRTFSVTFAG